MAAPCACSAFAASPQRPSSGPRRFASPRLLPESRLALALTQVLRHEATRPPRSAIVARAGEINRDWDSPIYFDELVDPLEFMAASWLHGEAPCWKDTAATTMDEFWQEFPPEEHPTHEAVREAVERRGAAAHSLELRRALTAALRRPCDASFRHAVEAECQRHDTFLPEGDAKKRFRAMAAYWLEGKYCGRTMPALPELADFVAAFSAAAHPVHAVVLGWAEVWAERDARLRIHRVGQGRSGRAPRRGRQAPGRC